MMAAVTPPHQLFPTSVPPRRADRGGEKKHSLTTTTALVNEHVGDWSGNEISAANHHRRRPGARHVEADESDDSSGCSANNFDSRQSSTRRRSYTEFNADEYASRVASKLPLAVSRLDNSVDIPPSRPSSSVADRLGAAASSSSAAARRVDPAKITTAVGFRVRSAAQGSTSGGSSSAYPPSDSGVFSIGGGSAATSATDRPSSSFVPSLMFSDQYPRNMPVLGSSSRNPPYRHLQETSSVESNDTPPGSSSRLQAETGATTADRPSTPRPSKTNSLDVRSSNSSLTISTTVTAAAGTGRHNLSPTNHQSSNDDDLLDADNPADVTYHPNSPRTNANSKPMIFERGSGSAHNLLRVPDKATIGAIMNSLQEQASADMASKLNNSATLASTNSDRFKESKIGGVEFEKTPAAGANHQYSNGHSHNSYPRYNNNLNDKQPRSRIGVHMDDGQRLVDFILVFERNQSTASERQRRYFETNLQQEGLVLESDMSDSTADDVANNKLCFVRVHAPWTTLCRMAEMLHMKMPLRNTELPEQDTMVTLNSAGWLATITDYLFTHWSDFNDTEKILIGGGARHCTAQFTRARMEKFLITDPDTFFTPTQRIRVVYEIMQKAKCDPDNGKKRGVQWLLKSGVYTAAYPIHDGDTETRHLSTNEPWRWSQRQILKHTWANFNRLFKRQPLNLIRSYFGEKIGFYFAWLGFYTQMLIFPSIVGVVCFLMGVFSLSSNPLVLEMCEETELDHRLVNLTMCPVCRLPNCRPWLLSKGCDSAEWNYRFDNESHVIMSIFTLLWATLFMELWKRKEAELAAEWDAFDAEQGDEPTRPEYEARTKAVRVSPVTNEEEPHVPALRRIAWMCASGAGVFVLILSVVAALIALIIVRIAIYGMLEEFGHWWADYKFEIASLIIHVFTFVVVMTLGSIYEPTAHRLTELECPRTQADYLSSYIWKVFIFEILNNFAPILYAALVRGRFSLPHHQDWLTEMCDPGGCLNEVVQAIGILLLARLLISNAAELGVPFLKSLVKSKGMGQIPTSSVHPEENCQTTETTTRKIPLWHRDFALNEPDLDGVYAEYLEMMVQFGYVTLFVAVFPLAPLICLLNNIVEIRIDATNFVTSFRRPIPTRVSGIRIWRRCMNIILKLSVLCNGAFLAFTSELIPTLVYRYTESEDYSTKGYMWWTMARMNTSDWKEYLELDPDSPHCYYRDFREDNGDRKLIWWQIMVARLAFFVTFVITFYFIQWLCDFLVPDVPTHVKLKVDRANFMARQSLYGQETSGASSASSGARARSSNGYPNHARHLLGGGSNSANLHHRRTTESTVETMVEYSPDQKRNIANGHQQQPYSSKPMANGSNNNGHIVRETTVDEEEASDDLRQPRWQWNGGDIPNGHAHPNQIATSPMQKTASPMVRMNGLNNNGNQRLKRDQTETSNV